LRNSERHFVEFFRHLEKRSHGIGLRKQACPFSSQRRQFAQRCSGPLSHRNWLPRSELPDGIPKQSKLKLSLPIDGAPLITGGCSQTDPQARAGIPLMVASRSDELPNWSRRALSML